MIIYNDMENFKGTKGEWYIESIGKKKWDREFLIRSKTTCNTCNTISNQYHICKSLETAVGYEQAKANALLISKAPEMLKLLEKLISDYRNDIDYVSSTTANEIQKLIKEATEI